MTLRKGIGPGPVGIIVSLLLLYCMTSYGQEVGGYTLPMKYSIHTYRVTMGNITNTYVWNIYDNTATRERIDAGTDKPYSKTTDYLVNNQWISGGIAYVTIEFTGNLEIGHQYRLAYKETSPDDCYIYQFVDFTLQTPIDIDIVQVGDQCPTCDLTYLEDPNPADAVYYPSTQTTLEYHIVMRNDDYMASGNWYFNYQIILTGQGGTSATIETVSYPGFTFNQPPLASNYTNNAVIAVAVKDVQLDLTINDVLGVRQRIDIRLDQIEGAYSERDIDVIVPQSGQNELTHYVNAIPAASYIAAMD